VTAEKAFVVHEQKMVDTMLSCDLLEGALDSAIDAAVVVSDDTDFVPPLLASAKMARGRICVLAPGGTLADVTRHLLSSKGVRVLRLEEGHGAS